jgi:hypothetical protein
MTTNKQIILKFIDDNLEWSDNKIIADKLKVKPCTVSLVRNGKASSKRILKALEARALEHYNHALKISEYSNTKLSKL